MRQNLSARQSATQGISWEVQHADPGGLRRRAISWRGDFVGVAIGDLAPWSDHPLLEGTSVVTGPRDTALERQILYGSGTHPNGLDLNAKWRWVRVQARQRIERADMGAVRLSSAVVTELGPVSLGLRLADSSAGTPVTRVASFGLQGFGMRGEAAWLDPYGPRSATAFQGQGRFASDLSRLDIQFRHLEAGFSHDGLSKRWSTGTAAAIGLQRDIASDVGLTLQLDGARDSLGKVGARTRSMLHLEHSLFDWIMAGTWSENMNHVPRWSIGSQIGGKLDFLSPGVAFAVSDSAGKPSASVRLGMKLQRGSQELSTSGSYATHGGPRWTAQHKTTFDAENRRLEFLLSVAGGLRPTSTLLAQGSLACAW